MFEPNSVELLTKVNEAMETATSCIRNNQPLDHESWLQVEQLHAAVCQLSESHADRGQISEIVAMLAAFHPIAMYQINLYSWRNQSHIEKMGTLLHTMLEEEHVESTQVQLRIGLALVESMLNHPATAGEWARCATTTAQRMDSITRGSIWLVCGELGLTANYAWALGKSLRFFRANRQTDMAVLLELRARLQLVEHYKLNIVARLWHSWHVSRLNRQAGRLYIGAGRKDRVLKSRLVWSFMPFDA